MGSEQGACRCLDLHFRRPTADFLVWTDWNGPQPSWALCLSDWLLGWSSYSAIGWSHKHPYPHSLTVKANLPDSQTLWTRAIDRMPVIARRGLRAILIGHSNEKPLRGRKTPRRGPAMKRPNTTACLKLTVARATTGRNCERIGHTPARRLGAQMKRPPPLIAQHRKSSQSRKARSLKKGGGFHAHQ
jgi:hypothetical protein